MPQILPFRGYRYDPDKVGDVEQVVTQPYDKISDSMVEQYRARHRCNIVRIIRNSHYQEARQLLSQWIQSGVLKQDSQPSLYPYQTQFRLNGQRIARTGLIGLIGLDDPETDVRGHERTLAEPMADRLELIRNTESNEGLIFTLFSEPDGQTDRLLSAWTATDPLVDVTDDYGTRHRLWKVSDPEAIGEYSRLLTGLPLYIADGHHRFRTSQSYYQECRSSGWKPAAVESYDKRMVALFNMHAPGVQILPTHRGIKNITVFTPPIFLQELKDFFEVVPCEDPQAATLLPEGNHTLGLVIASPSSGYHLKLKREKLGEPTFMPDSSGLSRTLDVNILHSGILDQIMGLGPEEIASGHYVEYFRDRKELLEGLEAKRFQLGFFLRPTTLDQVKKISDQGQTMPQKSTDFFPKLLTGLVLMKMEIEK